MSVQQVQGLALDPRTKILIWLLANVVVFAWTPEVFRMGVMLAYFILFLLERKGKMLAGLLLTSLPCWQYNTGCCRSCLGPWLRFLLR